MKTQNSKAKLSSFPSSFAPCSMLHALHRSALYALCYSVLFALCSMLLFCLFATPCFAQFVLANPFWRLPSLPNLPSGERIYDAGGASPDQPYEIDSVSRPFDVQGELKTNTDGVKVNKYKIEYNGNAGRIQGRTETSSGTTQEDQETSKFQGQTLRRPDVLSSKRIERRTETGKGIKQEDLEASELPGRTPRSPNTRNLGFQYEPLLLGRIGFDAWAGKPNQQTQD